MKTIKQGEKKRIFVEPGECFVTNENIVLSTLLGSCVSVCIYDAVNSIIGMNHFLLTGKKHSKEGAFCNKKAGKYGFDAMKLLIDDMHKKGAKRKNMKAKAFGGGNVIRVSEKNQGLLTVGDANCIFVRKFMKKYNIELVAEDLGGDEGRVIYFSAEDYSVYVRKIKQFGALNTEKVQKDYFRRSVKEETLLSGKNFAKESTRFFHS